MFVFYGLKVQNLKTNLGAQAARLGAAASPAFLLLGQQMHTDFVVFIVFGGLVILAGTNGQRLAEHKGEMLVLYGSLFSSGSSPFFLKPVLAKFMCSRTHGMFSCLWFQKNALPLPLPSVFLRILYISCCIHYPLQHYCT